MESKNPKIRLRPVIYTTRAHKSGTQNTTQQMFLLKALQVTQDPRKLRELMGVKTVAEVYQTLDKLAMRKEYHEALARKGISFDYIVGGIKAIADEGYKDADKLKAFQTLLKSVGMDVYKEQAGDNSGTWEEVLLGRIKEAKETGVAELTAPLTYAVTAPVVPESAKKAQEEEREMSSSIYDTNPGN